MSEWNQLIEETQSCIDEIMSHPQFPQYLKEKKVRIISRSSLGGKISHPKSIKVIGYGEDDL